MGAVVLVVFGIFFVGIWARILAQPVFWIRSLRLGERPLLGLILVLSFVAFAVYVNSLPEYAVAR